MFNRLPRMAAQLPTTNLAEERQVLHYNPTRAAFTGNAAALAEQYFGLFILFLVLTVIAFCLIIGATLGMNLVLVMVVVSAFFAALIAIDVGRPTNIEISTEGFRILWYHPIFMFSGPWIPWHAVQAADYVEAPILGEKSKCFDVTIDAEKIPASYGFELLSISVTSTYDKKSHKLRLIESGFFQEADRIAFLSAVRKYVPLAQVSKELIALESFGEVPTYTALWLDTLHKSNSASEQATLPDGTKLANGRYQIISRLGSGGQAVVYDALDT
ncbi:MAG: hypothetical protein ACRD3W_00910, partial [Terriglobales bacterium]